MKNLWFPNGTGGEGDGLGVWDGNAVKLGCDDGCTTINIIKFTEFKINKKAAGQLFHSLKEKERLDNLWF